MLTLTSELKAEFDGPDAFDRIMTLEGEVFRRHRNRTTSRVVIGGSAYFVKQHRPTGWGEILKNVLRGKRPALTADPEVRAIERLHELGVPTLEMAGHGRRGRGPDRLESFLITHALDDTNDLKELIPTFLGLPATQWDRLRRDLIDHVARSCRALHEDGINHRDLYTNHFLVRTRDWSAYRTGDPLDLHLIDLHRAQMRRRTPIRWLMKDLSGLLFSAYDAKLSPRDYARFWRGYWGPGWRDRVRRTGWMRRVIEMRARALYRKETGREPPTA